VEKLLENKRQNNNYEKRVEMMDSWWKLENRGDFR